MAEQSGLSRFNVFFDHNCPPSMAGVLREFLGAYVPKARVVALREVLPVRTSDIEITRWLSDAPGRWIFVSKDQRILRNPTELRAFREAGMRMLFVPKSVVSHPHHRQCALLLWQWPSIVEVVANLEPPVALEMGPRQSSKPRQIAIR